MKTLIALPLLALIAAPVYSNSSTTTTRSYESSVGSDADMIEAEEYDESISDENGREIIEVEEERMEERSYDDSGYDSDSRDDIDYTDRTRTNRERKAINTSSDASDDY